MDNGRKRTRRAEPKSESEEGTQAAQPSYARPRPSTCPTSASAKTWVGSVEWTESSTSEWRDRMSTVFGRRWPRTEELAEESGQEKRKAQLHKDGVGSKAMPFITGDRVVGGWAEPVGEDGGGAGVGEGGLSCLRM